MQRKRDLVVRGPGKRAERDTWQLDLRARVRRAANRIRKARVGHRHRAPLQVEDRVTERAVVLLELAFVQDRVDRHQHAGGAEALGHVAPPEGA